MSSPSQEPTHPVRQLTLAERARTQVADGRMGTLATISVKRPGYPFGSVAAYATDERGRPFVFLSGMAVHSRNLKADPRASLMVHEAKPDDPLGGGRVTLIGDFAPVPETEVESARRLYFERHPEAAAWAGFGDFTFYRMDPVEIYFVAGFGAMGWIQNFHYEMAQPDPVLSAAAEILEHMNGRQVATLPRLALTYANIEAKEARMTGIDHLGFTLEVKGAAGEETVRIAFPQPATSALAARDALKKMLADAGGTKA